MLGKINNLPMEATEKMFIVDNPNTGRQICWLVNYQNGCARVMLENKMIVTVAIHELKEHVQEQNSSPCPLCGSMYCQLDCF